MRSMRGRRAGAGRARGRALVGGAIGSARHPHRAVRPTSVDEARAYLPRAGGGLLEGGVGLLHPGDVQRPGRDAAGGAGGARRGGPADRRADDDPGGWRTVYGTDAGAAAERLDAWGADVVGLNCSVGPHGMLGARAPGAVATRPLSAQPNAGLPREIHGRKMYMASPEYMAKYAARLIRAGARSWAAAAAPRRSTSADGRRGARARAGPRPRWSFSAPSRSGARWSRCRSPSARTGAASSRAGELVTTWRSCRRRGSRRPHAGGRALLKEAGVDAVNVPDGPRAQMRMGVLATATLIQQRVGIETVVHYCCRDRNLLGMLSDLLGAHALGLRNLLLITGDPPKMGPYPTRRRSSTSTPSASPTSSRG
jgi:methionine synthase / methylenetetrahydrofolate reductase(NADPH)